MSTEKKHYYGIDFLRVFSCFAIIIMHVKANTSYQMNDYVYQTIVPSFTELVYLFLMISGFAMCIGYYDKFKTGTIDLNTFYTRRYNKIVPFFAFILVIAVISERTIETLMEALMEITLVFGFLPNNNLDTIGVSWTIGVVFLFYFIFPFFVVLIYNKKRTIFTFIIALCVNYFCTYYFFTDKFVNERFAPRHTLIYSFVYFVTGGLIYKFREEIQKFNNKHILLKWLLLVAAVVMYYLIPKNHNGVDYFTLKNVFTFGVVLAFGISTNGKICNNRIVSYLSSISMEMYLCQMILFRVVEKAQLLYVFGNNWLSFIVANIFTISAIILFVFFYRLCEKIVIEKFIPVIKRGRNLK